MANSLLASYLSSCQLFQQYYIFGVFWKKVHMNFCNLHEKWDVRNTSSPKKDSKNACLGGYMKRSSAFTVQLA